MDRSTFWGWDEAWEAVWQAGGHLGRPVRVVEEQRGLYHVATERGEHLAELGGRFRYVAELSREMPAVGDFVAATPGDRFVIHALLPRRSAFVRKAAGVEAVRQVVAANVDTTLLVQAADRDFSPRRLERYLALAWDGGSNPVVLLNKIDAVKDVENLVARAQEVAMGVPVIPVSAACGTGLEALASVLVPGKTVALLGSSGVGKSTLANALLGDARQQLGAVRRVDGRGRHTTTARQLFRLPTGTFLMDTPGMREVGLLEAANGVASVFADIDELGASCRFSDCRHDHEPGCAVIAAVATGMLEPERLDSYRHLEREQAFLARKESRALQAAARKVWAQRARAGRAHRDRKLR
jgi:ribosome biogenesis GTPase